MRLPRPLWSSRFKDWPLARRRETKPARLKSDGRLRFAASSAAIKILINGHERARMLQKVDKIASCRSRWAHIEDQQTIYLVIYSRPKANLLVIVYAN